MHLLVIDDAAIRRPFFNEAMKIVAKYIRLSATCAQFFERDQNAFQSWLRLNFGEELQAIEDMQAEQERLGRRLQEIAVYANLKSCGLADAFRELEVEDRFYQRGEADDRAYVDELRRRRLEEFEAKARAEAQKDPLSKKDRRFYDSMKAASDADIKAILRGNAEALDLFVYLHNVCAALENPTLFVRIWELAPQRVQKEFARAFKESTGESFAEVLERMQEMVGKRGSKVKAAEAVKEEGANPSLEEQVKHLYRKIAKFLHPDVQGQEADGLKRWREKTWMFLQDAYHRRDLKRLQELERIYMMRTARLNEMTIAELDAGLRDLKAEFASMREETKGLRKSPAWNFTRKKSHSTAWVKVKSELSAQKHNLQMELKELKKQILLLEMESILEGPAKGRR